MKVIVEGHLYELADMEENPGDPPQTLQFIHKTEIDGQFVTVTNGTTNEEVIAVLIDRIRYLDRKAHHLENTNALDYLEGALEALKRRTEERKMRGVEGTPKT
jgi:hypothetical protein